MAGRKADFNRVLTDAVRDMTANGFDGAARVAHWMALLKAAAVDALVPPAQLEEALVSSLRATYGKLVDRGDLLRVNPGATKFTIERVRGDLRAELDRRILASSSLIKLNREAAIRDTLQRFEGWATSIPIGGSRAVDKPETKENIRKSVAGLPFRERRVVIDQGHKLASALNDVVAKGAGAIAGVWHSHWRQANYNYREDHRERDEGVYLVRGSWAQKAGLVKAGTSGYSDEVTQPGEEVYCRCFYQYLYNLRDLPDDMVTAKGRAELERVRMAARAA